MKTQWTFGRCPECTRRARERNDKPEWMGMSRNDWGMLSRCSKIEWDNFEKVKGSDGYLMARFLGFAQKMAAGEVVVHESFEECGLVQKWKHCSRDSTIAALTEERDRAQREVRRLRDLAEVHYTTTRGPGTPC